MEEQIFSDPDSVDEEETEISLLKARILEFEISSKQKDLKVLKFQSAVKKKDFII